MSLLENANVFCINPNGVSEGCHFLTLVTCRPAALVNSQDVKKRFRTNSLPPSLEVYYESSSEKKCKSKIYDLMSTAPIRSLSEDFLRLSHHQPEVLAKEACLKCISNITRSIGNGRRKKRSARNSNVISKKGAGEEGGLMTLARPKFHKSIVSHPKSQFGFQCSGTALQIDGYMLSYFISEIKRSQAFRTSFIQRWSEQTRIKGTVQVQRRCPDMLVFVALMKEPEYEVLDLLGNKMVNSNILYRRCLEHALSWLSTLGGAFSALGDLSPSYAEEAGHVSFTQHRIAMKLGDPGIQSRCRLYAAISLLQRGYLKSCRDIVRKEYEYAMSLPEGSDPRLRRMCLGIWAKLQYHWKLVPPAERKQLKSTREGLIEIQGNAKYWSVYDLEENRKIMPNEENNIS